MFLTGDSQAYGETGPSGVRQCKHDANGNVVFQGDWCAATNQPATPGCADAVKLSGTFAAAGAKLD